jgi:transcriptional regulator with XRE-family HTH domain
MPRLGRKPDLWRRRQAQELRAQGLTMPQIGARLGITRQAVLQLLRPKVQRRPCPVSCAACGRVIVPDGTKRDLRIATLCLSCLARTPGATFAQRLRAYRVSAGLSQADLGRKAGVPAPTLSAYELGRHRPRKETLRQLVAVLGEDLAEGPSERPRGRPRRGT